MRSGLDIPKTGILTTVFGIVSSRKHVDYTVDNGSSGQGI